MKDITKKTKEELQVMILDKKKESYTARFAAAGAKAAKPHERRAMRRDVARIETELRRRELANE